MQLRLPAIIAALMLVAFCGPGVVAQENEQASLHERLIRAVPTLSEEQREELVSAREISRRYALDGDAVELRFVPSYADEIRRDVVTLEPTIGVEVLFLVDSPLREDEITPSVFHTMQAISTMEGIEYYSASRDRMRTFFRESYVIDNPENRERVPDPVVGGLPSRATIHVFQHDSSFGKNVYRLDYVVEAEALLLQMTNLTQMYYQRVLPALGPQELQMHLVVKPIGDKLLFYGTSAARPGFLFGMQDRVVRSFYNRLVALHDWFVDQNGRG